MRKEEIKVDKANFRTWAEIDLDAVCHNLKEIRRITDPKAKIMAVVKADAYGHGFSEVTRVLLENGADALAVACAAEAMQLRRENIKVPILILGYVSETSAAELVEFDLTATVFDIGLAEKISAAAVKAGKKAKIHIKVNTGMSRLGFEPTAESALKIKKIASLPGIEAEGIFSHFASADETNQDYTELQFKRFTDFCCLLEKQGIYIPIKHICNSAGIINHPEMHMDMVRPGIILYGHYPSEEVDRVKIQLKPVMSLKAVIVQVKDFPANTAVSYGRTFVTKVPSRLAVIPIGYADGFSRTLSGRAEVLVNGIKAPVVGNICMDQCMVDVTCAGEVQPGDTAVIFGRDGSAEITAEDVARHTISYELLCVIGKRIPRVYIKNNTVTHILDYMV